MDDAIDKRFLTPAGGFDRSGGPAPLLSCPAYWRFSLGGDGWWRCDIYPHYDCSPLSDTGVILGVLVQRMHSLQLLLPVADPL